MVILTMNNSDSPEILSQKIKDFLDKYPQLAETLKLFDLSYAQYKLATEFSNLKTNTTTHSDVNELYVSGTGTQND